MDVTESYVQALKRQKKFLENNPGDVDIQWQQKYVQSILSSSYNAICGLFVNSELIGTSGIQNIRPNEIPSFGIFVLDERSRSKGYGKTLCWATFYILNRCFNITCITAGIEKTNIASLKMVLPLGFKIIDEDEKGFKIKLNIEDLIKPIFIDKVFIE